MEFNYGYTKKDLMFKVACAQIAANDALGLDTQYLRTHITWQGHINYDNLDIETIRKISWWDFVADNMALGGPRNGHKSNLIYDKPLTWDEIEQIKDITKEKK